MADLNKLKKLGIIVGITAAVGGVSASTYAESHIVTENGKWINKQSRGNIEYINGENNVKINSSDFDTLATQLNNCDAKVTEIIKDIGAESDKPLSALNAGNVMLLPNGKIKSSSLNPSLEGSLFSAIFASKVGVDCTDANMTADNLSKDTKGYDAHGDLVIGTGKDVERAYQEGYGKGCEDTLANRQTQDISISYLYHKHVNSNNEETITNDANLRQSETSSVEGGCYTVPNLVYERTGTVHHDGYTSGVWTPTGASTWYDDRGWVADGYWTWEEHPGWDEPVYSWVQHGYKTSCGHASGEIVGAQINWD